MKKWLCAAALLLTIAFFMTPKDSTPSLKVAAMEPESLDPRLARSLNATTPLHNLFEGLMRHDEHNKLVPGVAERTEVSQDLKTYIFHLRDAHWSNGDRVTSQDFAKTWKSVLSPEFPSPNAYQLYPILNAERFKEGLALAKELGIETPDDKTLIIHLEYPIPYFLELVSTHFFLPIHASLLKRDRPIKNLISNGPYSLHRWKNQSEIQMMPNKHYWDHHESNPRIDLIFVAPETALQMYERDEIDWVGSPTSILPEDSISSLDPYNRTAAGTHWLRVNTDSGSLADREFRLLLSRTIDREKLVKYVLQGKQKEAEKILPPGWLTDSADLSETINATIPPNTKLSLNFIKTERNQKVAEALRQQWKETLGLEVDLNCCETGLFFDQLARGRYDLSLGSWYADFHDPINFLEVFKYKDNATNNTGWEHPRYIRLLDQAARQANAEMRAQSYKEAEEMLVEYAPVIPLFHGSFHYLKKPSAKGITISELGYLDFKGAFID